MGSFSFSSDNITLKSLANQRLYFSFLLFSYWSNDLITDTATTEQLGITRITEDMVDTAVMEVMGVTVDMGVTGPA